MIDLEPFSDPPSDREVRRVEKRFGKLPSRYRDYLLRSNGGTCGRNCEVEFQLADENESVMLGALFGISSNRPGIDLLASYESIADDLPKGSYQSEKIRAETCFWSVSKGKSEMQSTFGIVEPRSS